VGVAGVTDITVGDNWFNVGAVGEPDLDMNVEGLGVLVSSWMTGMILLLCLTAESPHLSSRTEVTN